MRRVNLPQNVSYLITSLLLIFFTLLFIFSSRISDVTYLGLVTLTFFVGFIIFFRKNISEIDVKNMRLIFHKTQQVKEEISKVALSLAKIISQLSAYSSGSWLNRNKLNNQIEDLLTTLEIDATEKKNILDLPRTVEKMMKDKDTLTSAEKKTVDEMFSLEEKSDNV